MKTYANAVHVATVALIAVDGAFGHISTRLDAIDKLLEWERDLVLALALVVVLIANDVVHGALDRSLDVNGAFALLLGLGAEVVVRAELRMFSMSLRLAQHMVSLTSGLALRASLVHLS